MNSTYPPSLRNRLINRLAAYFSVVALFCVALTSGSLYGYYRSTINRETREMSARFDKYLRDDLRRIKAVAELFASGQQTFCNDKKAAGWLREEGMTTLAGGDRAQVERLNLPGVAEELFRGSPVVRDIWFDNAAPGIIVGLPMSMENGRVGTAIVAMRRIDADWLKKAGDTIGAEFAIFDREGKALSSSMSLAGRDFTSEQNGQIVTIESSPYGFRLFPYGEEGLYGVFAPASDMRNLAVALSGALTIGFLLALLLLYIYYRTMIFRVSGEIEALAGWADGYLTNPEMRSPPQLEYVELKRVSEAFDNLVSRLDTALGEIERHNRELSALVAKKTGELIERGQLLDTVVSEMPQGVFLLDHEGRVVYANGHAAADFAVGTGNPLPEWLAGPISVMGDEPTDHALTLDGRDVLIHSRLVEGQTRRLVLVMDITERRVMEEQLYQTQKMESVSRLAGGVAHDFNNALAAIIPSVDMLRLKVVDEKGAGYLDNIEKAAVRSADVVRKLLAFSRAGSFTPKPVDVNEVIEGAIKVFQPTAKYAKLVWQPGENLPKVFGDEAQLQQLIFNLGINSLDATDGRCTITIKTWTDPARQSVFVSLSDDGPGVSQEIADHIFEPFFTTKKQTQSKSQGTGLGLAVAYGVVDRHCGRIRLVSGSQPGAAFEIELPAWSEAPASKSSGGLGRRGGDIIIGGK